MRKILSAVCVVCCMFCMAGCVGGVNNSAEINGGENNPTSFISCELAYLSPTRVAILVTDKQGAFDVVDCMNALDGEISFTFVGGMLTELNGKKNTADFSFCWMLYTSDEEMSNSGWGTIVYEESVLGSAVVGAESLPVEIGCLYVWEYQGF